MGVLSTNFEIGTFFNNSKTEETAFSFQAKFYKLTEIGKWKLRQFIKPQVVIGINSKLPADKLTINEIGIQGFNSAVYGTQ
jgi:hypothetical protein